MHQLQDILHNLVDTERMLLHLALFQQQAQAPDDFAGALVLADDVIENFAHLGDVGLAVGENSLRSLRVTKDGAERQVKFVGNRARKFAERGHAREVRQLVALTRRLLFGLLAFSDVERSAAHTSWPTVAIELDVPAPGAP